MVERVWNVLLSIAVPMMENFNHAGNSVRMDAMEQVVGKQKEVSLALVVTLMMNVNLIFVVRARVISVFVLSGILILLALAANLVRNANLISVLWERRVSMSVQSEDLILLALALILLALAVNCILMNVNLGYVAWARWLTSSMRMAAG